MPEFSKEEWVEIYYALDARYNFLMCHGCGDNSIEVAKYILNIMAKVDVMIHPWKEGMNEKEKG